MHHEQVNVIKVRKQHDSNHVLLDVLIFIVGINPIEENFFNDKTS